MTQTSTQNGNCLALQMLGFFSSFACLHAFWFTPEKMNPIPCSSELSDLLCRPREVWIYLHKQAKLACRWAVIWYFIVRIIKLLTYAAKEKKNKSVPTLSTDLIESFLIVLFTDNVLKIFHKTRTQRNAVAEDSSELYPSPCNHLANCLKHCLVPHYLHYVLYQ